MVYNYLKLLVLLLLYSSCESSQPKEQINILQPNNTESSIQSTDTFNEVQTTIEQSNYEESTKVKDVKFMYQNLQISLAYIEDRAYVNIQNNGKIIIDWHPILINFYYDMTYKDVEKQFHLLLADNQAMPGYLLFPAFTEQFPSYFLYSFSNNSLTYLGNYECSNFNAGAFSVNSRTNEITRYSDKSYPLHRLDDFEELNTSQSKQDIELIKTSESKDDTESIETNSSSLKSYENNPKYIITEVDVNKDGMQDKIVTSNRYQGDELLIFLSKNDGYTLDLQALNFSQDGGNQVSKISNTADGFSIVTSFPDRGISESTYHIGYENGSYWLNEITTESYSWQSKTRKNCTEKFHLNMGLPKEQIAREISKEFTNCNESIEQ